MAVVIRLKRTGAKKDTAFRIVVADSRRARDGRFIEQLGFYDPEPREAQYRVDVERAQYWLGVGAQASEQVRSLLKKAGVAMPSRARKAKAEKAAKPRARKKAAAGKPASAREQARRTRKRADRVARKKRVAKAQGKAAKSAEAPATA